MTQPNKILLTNLPGVTIGDYSNVVGGHADVLPGPVASPPAVPSSGGSVTNSYLLTAHVTLVVASGTATIKIAGATIATGVSGTLTVALPAGETITLTYTTAPTWAWVLTS